MKKKVMEKYDKNKNGKIDEDEKKAMRDDWNARKKEWSSRMKEKREEYMKKYDKNKDGKIGDSEKEAVRKAWAQGREEWRKKMAERRSSADRGKKDDRKSDSAKPSGDSREALFKRIMAADKNGDGKLNADEMPVRVRGGFSSADTNGDGFIDAAELRKRIFKD